jgi:hypothetical protein
MSQPSSWKDFSFACSGGVRVGVARLFVRTSCSVDRFVFIFGVGAETSVKFESAVENRRLVISSTYY